MSQFILSRRNNELYGSLTLTPPLELLDLLEHDLGAGVYEPYEWKVKSKERAQRSD